MSGKTICFLTPSSKLIKYCYNVVFLFHCFLDITVLSHIKSSNISKGTVDVISIDSSCIDVKFTKAPWFAQQWEKYRGSNFWKFILSFHIVLIRKSLNRKNPQLEKKEFYDRKNVISRSVKRRKRFKKV